MPARAKSLQITDRYRAGMIRLRQQGQREAKRIWNYVNPGNLDATFNLGSLELTVATLQREAARLSSAYLASFIASELGEPQHPPALSVWDKTFGGNPLREGLRSAIITAKQRIKDGMDPTEATRASRAILVSDVGLFIDTAARESLRQGMEMDDRIVGYQRAVKGTCGACSGDTTYEAFSPNAPVVPLNVHPNCQCVAEPVVDNKSLARKEEANPKETQRLDLGFVPGGSAENPGIGVFNFKTGQLATGHERFIAGRAWSGKTHHKLAAAKGWKYGDVKTMYIDKDGVFSLPTGKQEKWARMIEKIDPRLTYYGDRIPSV